MKRLFKRLCAVLISTAIVAVSLNGLISLDVFALTGNSDYTDYGGMVYYVDSVTGNDANSGTSETNAWKSLDKVNEKVYEPGDQILFKSGGVWSGRLIPQGSGIEGKPIIIGKYGGEAKPILNANSNFLEGSFEGSTVLLYNQEYYEIYDLEITNRGEGTQNNCMGIWVVAKDYGTLNHIVIEDCYVHNLAGDWRSSTMNTIRLNGSITDNYAYNGSSGGIQFSALVGGEKIPTKFNGIRVVGNELADMPYRTGVNVASDWFAHQEAGVNNELYEANVFSTNVYIANNIFHNTAAAVTVFSVDGSVGEGCIVERNVCYNNDNGHSFWVMWSACTIDLVYQYNEIYDMYQNSGSDDGLFDADGQSVGTIVQYNYTHNNAGPAYIYCEIEWDPNAYPDSYVRSCDFRYNISHNDNWGRVRDKGTLFSNGSSDCYFYNNTIYTDGYDVKLFDTKVENMYIYNNIFYSVGEGNVTYKYYGKENNTDERKHYISNNCFYGTDTPLPETNAAYGLVAENNFSADPKINLTDLGTIGAESKKEQGVLGIDNVISKGLYQLDADSPCIGAGTPVKHNGGQDFYGNTIPKNTNPDIGAHQRSTGNSTPSEIKNLTAKNISTERFTLDWDTVGGNSEFLRYQILLDDKPYYNIFNGNRRTEDFTLMGPFQGAVEIFDNKSIDILDLKENTEYEVKVRGYKADGSYVESAETKVKTESLGSDNKLKISEFKTYKFDTSTLKFIEKNNFKTNEVIHSRIKITDGAGRPVRGALVHVLFEVPSNEYEEFDVSVTDSDGYAKVGTEAAYLTGTQFEYNIKVYSVKKDGYTYIAGNDQMTVTAEGYDSVYNANLLNNSDFSNLNSTNGLPSTWRLVNAGSMSLIKNEGPNNNFNCIDIRSANTTSSQISQLVSNIPNGTYTLTAWVRNNNSASTFGVNNNGSNKEISIPVNEEWTLITIPEVKVTINRLNVYVTVPQFADYSIYTQICNIEISKNLMYNTDIISIKPVEKLELPAQYYYKTDSTTIDVGDTDLSAAITDKSFKAIGMRYYTGENFANAIRVNSDEEFSITMGQYKNNLKSGTYTFSAAAKSTGGVNGYLRIRDGVSGQVLSSATIESSDRYNTCKTTTQINSGSAYVEFVFDGDGDVAEYIEILEVSFANCFDIPSKTTMEILPGQNLMESLNGDFEQDGKATNTIPISWTLNDYKGYFDAYVSDETSVSGDFSMKCTLDEKAFHSLSNGAQMTSGAATPTATFTNLPSGTYTMKFWVKGNVKFKMGCTTDNRKNSYLTNIVDLDDTWREYVIEGIVVNEGILKIENWFDRAGFNYPQDANEEMLWAYIDNVSLTLDDINYVVNGNANSAEQALVGLSVDDANGYATLIGTDIGFDDDYSAMVVLPGSDSTLSASCDVTATGKGTFSFKTYILGNGEITFNIKSDKASEPIKVTKTATREWQEILIDNIEVNKSIEYISFSVKTSEDNTSAFVCIDNIGLQKSLTTSLVAKNLPTIKSVALGENLEIPKALIDGYTVTISDSSNKAVLALDGTVNTPDENMYITVTFKVTNDKDPSDVAYTSKLVTVYGYE